MISSSNPLRDLQEAIFALSVACPFDQGNPCACPLHEIRKKNLKERYAWIQQLSEESMLDIVTFHHKCMKAKEDDHPVCK